VRPAVGYVVAATCRRVAAASDGRPASRPVVIDLTGAAGGNGLRARVAGIPACCPPVESALPLGLSVAAPESVEQSRDWAHTAGS